MNSEQDRPLVLGIDGGNSKVDVALADASGRLLGAARGASVSHQAVGLEEGTRRLGDLVSAVTAGAGVRLPVEVAVASLAGADYPEDVALLTGSLEGLRIARQVVVVNDTIGAFRAGASGTWGVALVCGKGINAAAITPAGRQARFPGVGEYAGDWGGGGGIGMAALQAAVRGSDGRGPRTSLEKAVPAHFGLRRPDAVTRAFYLGKIPEIRIMELSPVAFAEAIAGDPVARDIITRLADELARMATALIRRLHMTRLPVEVVLAGGVFRSTDAEFYRELFGRIQAVAPAARFVHLASPPVTGAILMALDELARKDGRWTASAGTADALRTALGSWDRTAQNEAAPPKRGRRTVPADPTTRVPLVPATPQGHLSRRLHRLP